jgi:hypothetical protein
MPQEQHQLQASPELLLVLVLKPEQQLARWRGPARPRHRPSAERHASE